MLFPFMKSINKLKEALVVKNLDAFILHSAIMKTYLNLPKGSGIHVVITKDKNYLLFDGRYRNAVSEVKDEYELIEFAQGAYYGDEIVKLGIQSIGVEASSFLARDYIKLSNTGVQVVCETEIFQEIRLIKDENELQKIEHACDVTDEIFKELLTRIKPGMSENEIVAHLYYLVFAHGASGMSFDPIIASGIRGCLPHGRPTDKIVEVGEMITIDFGIVLDGYQSDMTRTIALGKPSDQMLEIYNIVKEAQQYGIDHIRAGVPARDVHQGVFDVIASYGYGEYFTHGLGHGIGIGEDGPLLNTSTTHILEDSMVMSCEPGIYVPSLGGVRIEDDVAIVNGKAKVLNKTTKELIVLEV